MKREKNITLLEIEERKREKKTKKKESRRTKTERQGYWADSGLRPRGFSMSFSAIRQFVTSKSREGDLRVKCPLVVL